MTRVDISKIATGRDLVDVGVVPKTSKEKLALVAESTVRQARESDYDAARTFATLYPHTIVPEDTARNYTRALIAGCDILVFGPPGSGKTSIIRDTINIFPNHIYTVSGCEMQCNPYSLFDRDFNKVVPACPQCKSRFGGDDYRKTGDFNPENVKPEEVPVSFMYVRDGFGISRIRGSPDTYPEDLAGKIDIRKLEEYGDPFHREVFRPGKLSHGNNGIVNINEIGKIPLRTQDTLLDALSEREVKPSNTRESVPAAAVYLCDTNTEDLDRINGPLNDRLVTILFPYADNTDQNFQVVLRNLYGKKGTDVERREQLWFETNHVLMDLPLSVPLEKAVCAAMIDYRNATISDRMAETGSNRVMIDALRLARANAVMEGRNYGNVDDIKVGLDQSIKGRIRARNMKDYDKVSDGVDAFIKKHVVERVGEETKKYWCEFAKDHKDELKDVAIGITEASKDDTSLESAVSGNNIGGNQFWQYVESTQPYVPKSMDRKKALLKNVISLVHENNCEGSKPEDSQ